MARTNVHIQSSVFQHASRIIKGTRSIVDTGLVDRIIILASYQDGFPREEHLDAERTVIRLPLFFSKFRKNLLTEMIILSTKPVSTMLRVPLIILDACWKTDD